MTLPLMACLAVAVLAPGCDEPPAPVGPPRCEPPEELVLERGLKRGFRALAEADRPTARTAFEAVLDREPQHPEARAGLRALDHAGPRCAPEPAAAPGQAVLAGGAVALALTVPVNTERYRFEELRAQARLAKDLDIETTNRAIYSYYRQRQAGAGPIDAEDGEAVLAHVDLIVLHDSRTQTARESFLRLGDSGGSTHFTIDYDGTVYQNLDLALEANHSGDASIDGRSISVDLVNPVTVDFPPLPAGGSLDRFARPLSEFVTIHGRELQHWAYTGPQLESLHQLVRDLVRALPQVPAELPGGDETPRTLLPGRAQFQGVLGHLHVSPRAVDPGAGFDWDALRRALR